MPPRKRRQTKAQQSQKSTQAKFGWCLTEDHKSCRVGVDGHTCGCKCHQRKARK